jgi:predicted xylose isomerase-like sugar epimerase
MFISDAADPQDLRSAQRRLKQAAQRTGLGGQVPPIAFALSRRTHATIAADLSAIGKPVVELS